MLVDFLGADEGCAVTTNATKTARKEGAGNSGLRPAPSAAPPAGERGLRESPSPLRLGKYLELSSQGAAGINSRGREGAWDF